MAIFENFSHQSFDLKSDTATVNNTTRSEWKNISTKPLESKADVAFWSGRAYIVLNIIATPFRFLGEESRGIAQIATDFCTVSKKAITTLAAAFEWVLQGFKLSDTTHTFKQTGKNDLNSVSGNFWATKNAVVNTLDHCGGCINRIPRTLFQEIRLILGLVNTDIAYKTPAKAEKITEEPIVK